MLLMCLLCYFFGFVKPSCCKISIAENDLFFSIFAVFVQFLSAVEDNSVKLLYITNHNFEAISGLLSHYKKLFFVHESTSEFSTVIIENIFFINL